MRELTHCRLDREGLTAQSTSHQVGPSVSRALQLKKILVCVLMHIFEKKHYVIKKGFPTLVSCKHHQVGHGVEEN